MKPEDAAPLLRHAANRARTRPPYLGWVLARYQKMESLEEDEVRQRLTLTATDWLRLQLCLRPRGDVFLPDLTRIAQALGIERAALAVIIRRMEAVEADRTQEHPGPAGRLLAARSRPPRPPDSEEPPDARP